MHRYITYPAYAYQIGRYSDLVSIGHKKQAHRVKPVRLLFISDYLYQRFIGHGMGDNSRVTLAWAASAPVRLMCEGMRDR